MWYQEQAAIMRVKSYAAPLICLAFKEDYSSFDELSKAAEGGYSHLVVTSYSVYKGRVKVILVGESLGY